MYKITVVEPNSNEKLLTVGISVAENVVYSKDCLAVIDN
jgi:hypothetical protein